jgi:hypothetical protein
MNSLIEKLIAELKSNKSINSSIATKVVLESINNSKLLGVSDDIILENSLATLEKFANELVNENLKEVVANFKKMAEKPTKSLQNMAKEAGLSMKLKAIKESQVYSDPVVKYSVSKLEEALNSVPEFKAIGYFVNTFSNFSYDSTVSKVLESINSYVNENRVKLEILNAIHDMRTTSSVMYSGVCSILESALLENTITSDSLKMKLRSNSNLPIVNRLINTISLLEAKSENSVSLGVGNGDTMVKPVISPFYKVTESEALVFLDNMYIKISEDADPIQVSREEVSAFTEFVQTCEAFQALNFKDTLTEIVSENRNLKIGFSINENGTLALKINNQIVENIDSIKFGDIFLMESIQTRNLLTSLFENLDLIVNLEFAKAIVNERRGNHAFVFNFGENIFVLEKLGQSRVTKKMKGLTFRDYVMENFSYDISDLYQIQLEKREEVIKGLDSEKHKIEKDLEKLEGSISNIDKALDDKEVSPEYHEKLSELKHSLEKTINSLKEHYVLLDQSKKKF